MRLKKLIEEFEVFLSLDKGCSKTTTSGHVYRIKKFYRWLGKKPFNLDNCKKFLYHLKQKDYLDSTIMAYIISFRHWAGFLIKQGRLKKNFAYELKLPKPEYREPELISPEDLKAILSVPQGTRHPDRYRNDTLLLLLAETGMRVGEVVRLKVQDLDFLQNVITIRRSKTKRGRLVPIKLSLLNRLKKQVKNKKAQDYVFGGRNDGAHLRTASVWMVLKRRLEKAGIEKRIHPHSFRHSFITEMLRQDVSVLKVQRIVGHVQLSTTQRYAHLVFEDLKDCIERNKLTSLV